LTGCSKICRDRRLGRWGDVGKPLPEAVETEEISTELSEPMAVLAEDRAKEFPDGEDVSTVGNRQADVVSDPTGGLGARMSGSRWVLRSPTDCCARATGASRLPSSRNPLMETSIRGPVLATGARIIGNGVHVLNKFKRTSSA
jgi:hypothetical protein